MNSHALTTVRSPSEKDRGLTELDAPLPVHEQTKGLSLEEENHEDDRNELTETAAAPPVEESRPRCDEKTASGSQEDFESKRKDEQKAQTQSQHSSLLTELYTVSWLVFFSFLGTLARLGVEAITLYPNTPFPSRVLWANLGGSFAMGFLVEDRKLFRDEWGSEKPSSTPDAHLKVKKTLPLYIGLSTGFCGCFTSFSSFMRDAFLALTNALQAPSPTRPYHNDTNIPSRNGGFSFLALLAIVIIHPAVSLAALKVGAHFALLIQPFTPSLPFRLFRRFVDPLAVLLAFGCWLGSIFLSIWPPGNDTLWRFRAVFPLVFAPLGCLLRFYASKYLNARIPAFPLGTFACNIFGTAVLGMAWDLQHARGIGAGSGVTNACSVLQGVMEGFCGCLTTVSTWVLELDGLRRRHAWIYGLTSVGVGLSFMVVIMGSMGWTVGFAGPGCG